MTAIIHDDLELWLTGWLRAQLAARPEAVCRDVKVDNKEPGPNDEWPKRLVVVRDDGSSEVELNVDSAALGVTIFAGTKVLPKEANDLARIVRALIRDCARVEPGNPVAAVTASAGPFKVDDERPEARRYLTFELAVVGSAL
ncbi:hypothetical protein [Microbacterium maritypicum]|uniref:Uncharacterized protein n=2 Tax=Microbacterium maritypicum TaxID=33918 RepID=A0ACD4B952_MICMQ|nr:hypothetical protein [Microbacterium liquefaciens]UTT53809.1 hypothetical protein NMQ05_04300 [Microbacterium liquefaciens]UTT53875.1 hypothetical protein NMQ05_04635 [Microbacterium liquefaciens]